MSDPNRIKFSPKFTIAIKSNGVEYSVDEYMEEKNITDLLTLDTERIHETLETHAANQAYWEALAVKLKNKLESFENEWCKKWWAHSRKFAKYVLFGYGDTKPTVDSVKDMVILIYSEDTTDLEREKYSKIAFEMAVKRRQTYKSEEEFRLDMYKYSKWYFEVITRTLGKMKEDYEIVHIVAKRFDSRSFHVGNLVELVKAKKSNIGPMSVSEKDLMHSTSETRR